MSYAPIPWFYKLYSIIPKKYIRYAKLTNCTFLREIFSVYNDNYSFSNVTISDHIKGETTD